MWIPISQPKKAVSPKKVAAGELWVPKRHLPVVRLRLGASIDLEKSAGPRKSCWKILSGTEISVYCSVDTWTHVGLSLDVLACA